METIASQPAGEHPGSIVQNALTGDKAIAMAMPSPVDTADRIRTVDLVRGFALLGILLMNIPGFGIDGLAFYKVLSATPASTDYSTMMVIFSFFDGTMRGLFSMLFGAGMILFTLNKKEKPGGVTVAEYYYRRLLLLVAFGLFNAYVLLWDGDILFYYGLCGMLLYPFRKTKPKWLILIGILCIGIGILKTMIWYGDTRTVRSDYISALAAEKSSTKLTEKQQEAKTAWMEREKSQLPDTAASNKNIAKMHSGYTTIFNYFIPRNSNNETWGTYGGIWDMLSMMFIGMGLFVAGFFSNRLSGSIYAMGLVVGYGLGIPIGYVYFKGLVSFFIHLGPYLDSYSVPHLILYDLRRVLLCIGHASLLILVYRSRLVPWLMKSLACVGQMAFTNYLTQSIICTWYFYGYGFDHYNDLKFHQLYYVVAIVWIFQMIASPIWLSYFRFGPFEWLWRSLTYWKKQPMLRQKIHSSEELAAA